MSLLATEIPYSIYFDSSGEPLDAGYLYFGIENQNPQTAPIAVYWDAAGTQPVAQPVRTRNGFPLRGGAIGQIYCASAYSVTVLDQFGQLVQYAPTSSAWSVANAVLSFISSIASSIGASLMGWIQAGAGMLATTVQAWMRREVALSDANGVDPTGNTECGAAIRAAIAQALAAGTVLNWDGGTYLVGPDPASPTASGFHTWCLHVPTGARWRFHRGCTIKQAASAQSWCRVISTESSSDFKIFGELRVDANVANISATNNEQMHGVFIFNSVDSYIERIDSRNARGDNVFIGGTDENTYGKNVVIGSIRAVTAGRKNVTLHYCDALTIDVIDADNSAGGAACYGGSPVDNTDGHSFHVEPDTYTGTTRFEQRIGRIRTTGRGNSVTAGTTPTQADGFVVNVGSFEARQSSSSATIPFWIQNGVTLNVDGEFAMIGLAGIDSSVQFSYAARFKAQSLVISGASLTAAGFLAVAAASAGDENRPEINVAKLEITNSVGAGWNSRSAIANIGVYKVKAVGFALEGGESVTSQALQGGTTIDHLISRDSGAPSTGALVNAVIYSSGAYAITIRQATILDMRGTPTGAVVNAAFGTAAGLLIGSIDNPNSLPIVNWAGADKYYRQVGGPWTTTPRTPGMFICHGTPLNMIPAPVGSIALRDDGGASTSFYVKEAGTGTTGWVGK